MMELVYLWVEKYKNIKNQGFNFSSKFECTFYDKYDEDGCKLDISKKNEDEYIEDFFGKNINVTAIVGKNGSGKSSILNAIINSSENDFTMEEKYILVYSDLGKSYYHSNFKLETTIANGNNPNFVIYLNRENNDNLPINSGATKLSNPKDHKSAFTKYNEILISKDIIINLLAFEIEKIDSSFKLSTFMYLPNKISIELKTSEELISNHIMHIIKKRQEFEDYFMALQDKEHQLLIIEYLRSNSLKGDNIIEKIKDKNILNSKYSFSNIIELIDKKKEVEINELNEIQKNIYFGKDGFFHLLNFDLTDEKNRHYDDLSHGEQMIFGQLLNLYFYTYHKDNSNIFLFDEPEIALHPDWQKRYMNEVITLLEKTSEENHFIFTTHSPFLLSDIPKQNIIFLDKDEDAGNCKVVDGLKDKKQTFGANIHTLLSDSFFMEDGLMGEFANKKIQEIMDYLNDKKTIDEISTKIEQIKKVIESIGEPFLKEKLSEMYFDKFDTKKQDRIKELKAELQRLEDD